MIYYTVTDMGRQAKEDLDRALTDLNEMLNISPSDIMNQAQEDNIYRQLQEFADEFGKHFHNHAFHYEDISLKGILETTTITQEDLDDLEGEGWLEKDDPDEDLISIVNEAFKNHKKFISFDSEEGEDKIRALNENAKNHIKSLYEVGVSSSPTSEEIEEKVYTPIRRFFLHCIGII